jgi:hypothetical protein
MSLACCTSRTKNGREKETADLRRIKLTYHRSATENPFTKSDLMKSIVSDSAVLAVNRCIGFVAVMALAAISQNRVSAGVTVRAAPPAGGYSVFCSAN